jgi:hypothetical protein
MRREENRRLKEATHHFILSGKLYINMFMVLYEYRTTVSITVLPVVIEDVSPLVSKIFRVKTTTMPLRIPSASSAQ